MPPVLHFADSQSSSQRTVEQLFSDVIIVSDLVNHLDLAASERFAICLPNNYVAIVWFEALKRLGRVYVPLTSGMGLQSVQTRVQDICAKAVVADRRLFTCEGVKSLRSVTENCTFIGVGDGCYECLSFHSMFKSARTRVALHVNDSTTVQDFYLQYPCLPVEASYPLFVMYTSGSTGKPKGIVHAHAGYAVGIVESAKRVMGLGEGDNLFVVGNPGWITGQSYMISVSYTHLTLPTKRIV